MEGRKKKGYRKKKRNGPQQITQQTPGRSSQNDDNGVDKDLEYALNLSKSNYRDSETLEDALLKTAIRESIQHAMGNLDLHQNTALYSEKGQHNSSSSSSSSSNLNKK